MQSKVSIYGKVKTYPSSIIYPTPLLPGLAQLYIVTYLTMKTMTKNFIMVQYVKRKWQ